MQATRLHGRHAASGGLPRAPVMARCPAAAAYRASRQRCAAVVCAAVATRRTHYDVLGIRDSASVRDIKDAFRRLALMWHPDRNKQAGAKDKFMELKSAYDTLVDMTTRQKYDRDIKQASAPPPSAPGPVGYDWNKYRASSVRRSASATRKPQQSTGYTGFRDSTIPPRPPPRATAGDDFEAYSSYSSTSHTSSSTASSPFDRSPSASAYARSPSASAYARSPSASTSPFARSPSAAAGAPRAPSAGGYQATGGYQSIFGGQPAGAAPGMGGSNAAPGGASGAAAYGSGSNGVFTRVGGSGGAYAQPVGRSSSRSRSTSRSSSASRSGAWTVRTPSPAQQWHATHVHSGDDFLPSGTTHAATEAMYAAATRRVGSGSTSSPASFAAAPASNPLALPDPSTTWKSASATTAVGDDYLAQAALVPVEKKETLPVKAAPAWNTVGSFISISMSMGR